MADIINAVIIEGAVKKLHDSIKEFNVQAAEQNKRMINLTIVISVLTLVMLIAVGVQIYISITPK